MAFEAQAVPHVFSSVASGDAALARLTGSGPDQPELIILSLNRPRLNGFEVLERLKADGRWTVIPVVVLTTPHRPADEQRAAAQLGALLAFWHHARVVPPDTWMKGSTAFGA